MTTDFLVPKNNAASSANGAIGIGDLTIVVADGSVFPVTYPFHISIESEILRVTNNAANVLTVVRAQEGTAAAAHASGVAVELLITAKAVSDLNSAVNVVETLIESGAQQGHTTATAQWNAQTGNARKVLLYDSVSGKFVADYLTAIDVMEPAQVTAFTVQPSAAGYPDDDSGLAMVASSGTDGLSFAMAYVGTPTAASIDILSHTYGGGRSPEAVGSDYPISAPTPYTSLTPSTSPPSKAINRGQAVAEAVTFRVSATVNGQAKTRDVTLTYINERMQGKSSVADIDTEAKIDTFYAAQNKGLSNAKAITFAVTLGAGEYAYYVVRTALGAVATDFYINPPGAPGGFTKVGSAVSWDNARGFRENFDVWRSTNPNLGAITVQVI